jgi:two-component system LytT family response regulator
MQVSSDDDYVVIHARQRSFMVFIRLKDLEARLAGGPFLRVHRGHLINIAHVVRWRRYPGRRLEIDLSDGSSVLSSRRLRTGLLERLPTELCELGPHPPVPFTEVL